MSLAFEQHYTVEEIATLWHRGEKYVRAKFRNEPGVQNDDHFTPGKRPYKIMRIPESVVRRVHDRMRKH